MRRPALKTTRLALTPAVVLALLVATGCTATSHVSHCVDGTCAISLSGEQTLQVDLGSLERDLRVSPIEPTAITVSARGDSERVPAGGATTGGDLAVRVVSIAGREVHLQRSAPRRHDQQELDDTPQTVSPAIRHGESGNSAR